MAPSKNAATPTAAAEGGAQTLLRGDAAAFRCMMKFYDSRMYKKANKAADGILKKFASHGETLSMKGLILWNMPDKKTEAYEYAKKGLRNNLRSHMCWHVLGLMYRQDKDYIEAAKCYNQALRLDPENIQILRDLCNLQIHERKLEGFRENRRKILRVKSRMLRDWTALSLAHHLCGDSELGGELLDECERLFKDMGELSAHEATEMRMYRASLFEESGEYRKCVDYLETHQTALTDGIALLEMQGRAHLCLGEFSSAAKYYSQLFERNSENESYLLLLLLCQEQFQHLFVLQTPPPLPSSSSDNTGDSSTTTSTTTNSCCGGAIQTLSGVVASYPPFAMGPPPARPPSECVILLRHGVLASCRGAGQGLSGGRWGWVRPEDADARMRWFMRRQECSGKLTEWGDTDPLFCVRNYPTAEQQRALAKWFDDMVSLYPKSDTLQRLPLNFFSGDLFFHRLDMYLRPRIRNGVPSLYALLSRITTEQTVGLVTTLLESYVTNLSACREAPSFGRPVPHPDYHDNNDEDYQIIQEVEGPSCVLHCLMLLAQLYDYLGRNTNAQETVDTALKHTPTLPELYLIKARIHKNSGQPGAAAEMFEKARLLDLADRYVNTKAAKHWLAVDEIDRAAGVALLFSKQSDSDGLHDMQCMWYESCLAKSHLRLGNLGKALKQLDNIRRHFADIREDQYDFHSYCIRRLTYRSYVRFLKVQDQLFSHTFYRNAAENATNIYLHLYDQSLEVSDQTGRGEGQADNEVDKDKKKKKKKQEIISKSNSTTGSGTGKPADPDPDGGQLLQKNPLEAAMAWVCSMRSSCHWDPGSHALIYRVAYRKGALLLMVQSLYRLWHIRGRVILDRILTSMLAHFCATVDLAKVQSSLIRSVTFDALREIMGLNLSCRDDDKRDPTEGEEKDDMMNAATVEIRKAGERLMQLMCCEEDNVPQPVKEEKVSCCGEGRYGRYAVDDEVAKVYGYRWRRFRDELL
eukprot:GHVS01097428.1.p1 GENE.GHVS01097428.1~~GHVS01097428.1.p1  ORF type:complete len:978 (-),score=167.95 GHVS01097428.1:29-2962(-)